MAETFYTQVARRLKPGYRIIRGEGNQSPFHFYDPHGHVLTNENGKKIALPNTAKTHAPRGKLDQVIMSQLRNAGAFEERKKRTHTAKDMEKRARPDNPKSPINMADEIMRDPQATARERGMARAFIQLRQDYARAVIQTRDAIDEMKERMKGEKQE